MNYLLISSSALKRQLKAAEREKKKAEAASKQAVNKPKAGALKEEELDDQQYYEMRLASIRKLKEEGKINPYPHKFSASISVPEFRKRYDHLEKGQHLNDVEVSIAGRLYSKRSSGTKLIFYDLHSDMAKVQVMFTLHEYHDEEEFYEMGKIIHRGDVVGIVGKPCKTKLGELSILPTKIVLLAPCLQQLPHSHFGLKDKETRHRQRHLDLIMNKDVVDRFYNRFRICKYLESYLDSQGFLGVSCTFA